MSVGFRYLLLGGLCLYVCVVLSFLSILQQNTDTSSDFKLKYPRSERTSYTEDITPFQRENRIARLNNKNRFAESDLNANRFTGSNFSKGTLVIGKSVEESINALNTNFLPLFDNHFVYSAYVDKRKKTEYVRIIAIGPSGKGHKRTGFFCHFGESVKRSSDKVFSTELIYYETCESHLMVYSFYIMSCPIPDNVLEHYLTLGQSNITITRSNLSTRPGIELPVLNNEVGKTTSDDVRFGLCIPPLFGNINVLRFVEFIELSRLLGSEHFTFYAHELSHGVKSVLHFYEKAGIATVLPWKLPVQNIWYKGQSVAIGDCLFRNMYRYNFVAFNDIDEFILPHQGETWEDMLEYIHLNSTITAEDTAVYRFKSSFFTPTKERRNSTHFPKSYKLFISLNNTYRTVKVSNIRTKLLVNPTRVFEIGIHHLSKPIDDKFVTLNVDPQVALLHHYRKCDPSYDMSCGAFKEDTTALKYTHSLISHTEHVLKEIQHLDKTFNTSGLNKL